MSPKLGWWHLGGVGGIGFGGSGVKTGGKRVVFWVLEPQDVHSLGSRASGWEMGPQCVTRVGVVSSWGGLVASYGVCGLRVGGW